MDTSLKKEEILNKKIEIQELLYNNNNSFSINYIKVIYNYNSFLKKSKVCFFVSKKKFKKASDRNYIKRLLKNSYRLNKFILNNNKKSYRIIFIYNIIVIIDFKKLNFIMNKILNKIIIK